MATALLVMINITYISVSKRELELNARRSVFRANVIARDLLANTDEFTEDWGLKADALLAPFIKDEQVRVIIFNDLDRVLVDTGAKLRGSTLEFQLLNECRGSKEPRYALYQVSDGTKTLYTIYPILRDGQYQGAVLRIEESDPAFSLSLGKIVQDMALHGLPMIALASFLGHFLLSKYLEPLNQLEMGVGALIRGNFDYRISKETGSDFSPLTNSFNVLGTRLGEVEEQQSEFVASVSHEIKTPIAALKIITESLLEAKETVDRETVFDFLKDVETESERLHEIVEDLLYLVKLEKKQMSLDVDVRPMNRCLEDSIQLLLPMANQNQITLHSDFTHKIFAEFDYNRFKQVFINLIANGIKYNSPGGHVTIRLYEERQRVHIEIEDDGWGIPEEDLPYIFNRFYRVDKGRARLTGGTGLGLSIAKEIVSLHFGEITVKSEFGEGTQFLISLPKRVEVPL